MPSIHPVRGTAERERNRRWFFDWYNQWPGLLPGHNWQDFTLIKIEGEYSSYSERWEFCVRLLGFGITITYVYGQRFNDELAELCRELDDCEHAWRPPQFDQLLQREAQVCEKCGCTMMKSPEETQR